jgi:hypothetical protein
MSVSIPVSTIADPLPEHLHMFDDLMPPEGLRAELAVLARHIARAKSGMKQELMLVDQRMALAMWTLLGPNRSLRGTKIKRYHKIMDDGRWESTHQGMMFDTTGRLRDGQHRLGAMLKYGKPLQIWVCFGCDPKAFEAVDQGEKRTASDLYSIDKIPNASLAAATVNMLMRIEEGGPVNDSNEVLDRGRELRAESERLDTSVKAAGPVHRRIKQARPSAMALAHLWISEKSKSGASKLAKFWDNLSSGADISKRDARLTLQTLLTDVNAGGNPMRGGTGSYGLGMRQAGAVVLCWNNWVRGKPISLKALKWDAQFKLPEDVF